jgi:tRNA pseudouridine55 synthase
MSEHFSPGTPPDGARPDDGIPDVARREVFTDGLIIVDKPAGWTSHDVVARLRRLAGTRRVGHAGTLDPMATGVLVTGIGKATRLLGHLALADKEYLATIRLGQATSTGDAEGEVIFAAPAGAVTLPAVRAAARPLTGDIQQVPPAVSAVKVAGTRAYRLARAGTPPALAPRAVTVRSFGIIKGRRAGDVLDVDVAVTCSSGTYIRALARDLGEALGVGGHLTALRRTRAGRYGLGMARRLDELEAGLTVIPLARAAADAFPSRQLTGDEARRLAHGGRLPGGAGEARAAAFAPDGTLIALVEERDGAVHPLVVFADQPRAPSGLSALPALPRTRGKAGRGIGVTVVTSQADLKPVEGVRPWSTGRVWPRCRKAGAPRS